MLINSNSRPRSGKTQPARALARGVSLIEVLVTVIVTSVGLLGVAALQLSTLRNNFDATVRTKASVLAADIADRMRANRTAAINGDYNITLSAAAPTTTTTQAQVDLADWKTTLAAQLPSGKGSVLYTAATKVVLIDINWNERDNATAVDFSSTTEL